MAASEKDIEKAIATGTQDRPPPFSLTSTDKLDLAQSDDDFHAYTWEELKEIIAEHKLEVLRRWPSDLKRYLKWSTETKAQYGSIPTYIMKERLKWEPLPESTPETGPKFATANSTPFADEHDFKIMPNDWPYGMAPGIRHLVVWLKTRLESEPTKGDVTPKSRQQIEDFIQKTFIDRVKDLPGDEEKVIWFKNWKALQSVPGMEHVHVLMRDVPEDVILEWCNGETMKQD